MRGIAPDRAGRDNCGLLLHVTPLVQMFGRDLWIELRKPRSRAKKWLKIIHMFRDKYLNLLACSAFRLSDV
jgi:hypothetical protein